MLKKKSFLLKSILITTAFICTSMLPLRTSETLVYIKDKKGDDYGAGTIKYPRFLQNEKGLFDMRTFSVKEDDDNFEFNIKMANLKNQLEEDNGFSNLLLDIYISVDDNGLTMPIKYGSAVLFDEDSPWKYRLKITPKDGYIEFISDKSTVTTEKVDCDVSVSGKTVTLKVKKDIITEDLKKAKFYIFSGGFDLFGPDQYRKVAQDESEYEFSGGISAIEQPNIIDTFNQSQKKLLNYFIPPDYATVLPVYMTNTSKFLLKEYVYIAITIIALIILYTECRKNYGNKS